MEDSFTKGLRLLEALASAEKPIGLTRLAEQCGLVKSHAHKFLKTLVEHHYVRQTHERGPYQLTFKLWELGSRALVRADLVSAARQPMQELSALTRETATLAVYDRGDAIYIYKIDGTHEVRPHTEVGRRRPAYCVAAGKAIMAFQSERLVAGLAPMKRHTAKTVGGIAELREQFKEIRRLGYAVNWGEWTIAVRGLAAPVFGADGQAIAAVNLSVPAERLDAKAVRKLAPQVMSYAARISRELGYVPSAAREEAL